jgi:hypothetical protein
MSSEIETLVDASTQWLNRHDVPSYPVRVITCNHPSQHNWRQHAVSIGDCLHEVSTQETDKTNTDSRAKKGKILKATP